MTAVGGDDSGRKDERDGGARDAQLVRLFSSDLPGLFLFAGVFLYGIYRCQFGIDFSDEGLYLSAPFRYTLGDVPFRDEILNPHHMFDLVLFPIFYAFPEITVFQLRVFWLVFQFGSMLVLYTLLKRFGPAFLVAMACGATVLFTGRLATPGYHTMAAFFFILSFSLWLHASLARGSAAVRILLASASGLVAFLATLCYLPFLAVLAVPAIALVQQSWSGNWRAPRAIAAGIQLLTAGVLIVIAVLCGIWAGLADDWMSAHRAMLTIPHYSIPVGEKLRRFLSEGLFHGTPVVLASAAAFCLTFRVLCLRDGVGNWIVSGLRAGAFGAILILLLLSMFSGMSTGYQELWSPIFPVSWSVTLLAIGAHLGILLLPAHKGPSETQRDWSFVYACLLASALVFAVCQVVFSLHPHKIVFALLPLFAAGMVANYRSFAERARGPSPGARAAICVALIIMAVGYTTFSASKTFFFGDAPKPQLTTEFSTARLARIRSSQGRVKAVDDTVAYLSGKLSPGDFLLAYDYVPLFYFLTGTRPAVDAVWQPRAAAGWVRRNSLQHMIENDRVPEYCIRARSRSRWEVRYSKDPTVDPLNAFVERNYTVTASFPPFEVWKLTESSQRRIRSQAVPIPPPDRSGGE